MLFQFFENNTELICNNITNIVQPIITPNMVGTVFLIPKLKAVYDVIILFGPGEREAAIPKSNNEINWTTS